MSYLRDTNLALSIDLVNIMSEHIKLSRFRWLYHVGPIVGTPLPYRALFSFPPSEWKKPR